MKRMVDDTAVVDFQTPPPDVRPRKKKVGGRKKVKRKARVARPAKAGRVS